MRRVTSEKLPVSADMLSWTTHMTVLPAVRSFMTDETLAMLALSRAANGSSKRYRSASQARALAITTIARITPEYSDGIIE